MAQFVYRRTLGTPATFTQEPLTTGMLAAAPMQEQKQMLGERLFPLIQVFDRQILTAILLAYLSLSPMVLKNPVFIWKSLLVGCHHLMYNQLAGHVLNTLPLTQRQHADLAGKITGMLLEIDNSELLHMLEDPASLQGKVQDNHAGVSIISKN